MLPHTALHAFTFALTLGSAPLHPVDHFDFCWDKHEIKAHFEEKLDGVKVQRISSEDFKVTGYTDTKKYIYLVDACDHDVHLVKAVAYN
jgi:hypothetical protein